MFKTLYLQRCLVLATLFCCQAAVATEKTWPEKPVKLVVSHAPGSSTDIVARYLAAQFSKRWAYPMVIENRPGGQNIIASQAVARAAPDGYTLFYGTTAALVSNTFTVKNLPYNPALDFTPIRFVGYSPFMIAAHPDFQASTLKEALLLAKADPKRVAVAMEGARTFSGILAGTLRELGEAQWTEVSYSKSSEALQDTIAGRTQLVVLPSAVVLNQVLDKRLKALAVSTESRLSMLPAIPSLGETFPGFGLAGWHMLVAPAATPAAVLKKLNAELNQILALPEVEQHLAKLGIATDRKIDTLQTNRDFLAKENHNWSLIAKRIGLQAE